MRGSVRCRAKQPDSPGRKSGLRTTEVGTCAYRTAFPRARRYKRLLVRLGTIHTGCDELARNCWRLARSKNRERPSATACETKARSPHVRFEAGSGNSNFSTKPPRAALLMLLCLRLLS